MSYKLSYNELFYLGTLLNAEYLDYMYYSAIDDIGSDKEIFIRNMQDSLYEKKLIAQNFSGDITVDEQLQQVLYPLFFSLSESELDVFFRESPNDYRVFKIHSASGKATTVRLANEYMELYAGANTEQIFKECKFDSLDSHASSLTEEPFVKENVSIMIIVKKVDSDSNTDAELFSVTDQGIYRFTEDDGYHAISYQNMKSRISDKLENGGKSYGLS